jgi:hypothetical protein
MQYKTYKLGTIEVFANDVYYKSNRNSTPYKYLTWYDAEDFLRNIKDTGHWRFPTLEEITFLNQEYRPLNILGFSNSAYWIYDEVLSKETSEDWSIGYYFDRKGAPGRRGGIPKSELLCLRPVRSI